MKIAIYPGSFDPVTNGHLDIARRGARLFDQLVVAVYKGPPKNVLFSPEQRVEMWREAVRDLANVQVDSFDILTVDYARQMGAQTIVRGLRAISDFEWELQLAHMYRHLAPDVEIICLMTSQRFAFLSSSIVKEAAMLGGSLEGLVPLHVAEALHAAYRRGRHG